MSVDDRTDDRVAIMEAIESALDGGTPVVVTTVVEGGEPAWLRPGAKLALDAGGRRLGSLGNAGLDEAVLGEARAMFTTLPRETMQTLYAGADGGLESRPSRADRHDAQLMLQLFEAPARLVVVGGGHVGLSIATIGEIAGFAVTVIDDREEFANRERFPMAEQVIAADVDEALAGLSFDPNTYVVLVSRGHRQDEDALRHVVGRGAAYVGMIGSRRRVTTVLRHLAEEEFAQEDLDAVATPIGLDIGAETPEEIAISILAEIVMVRRGGTGQRMRLTRAERSLIEENGEK